MVIVRLRCWARVAVQVRRGGQVVMSVINSVATASAAWRCRVVDWRYVHSRLGLWHACGA